MKYLRIDTYGLLLLLLAHPIRKSMIKLFWFEMIFNLVAYILSCVAITLESVHFLPKSEVSLTIILHNTDNIIHIIMHNSFKHKIVINWNFGNKLILFLSMNSCHKKWLLHNTTEYPFNCFLNSGLTNFDKSTNDVSITFLSKMFQSYLNNITSFMDKTDIYWRNMIVLKHTVQIW